MQRVVSRGFLALSIAAPWFLFGEAVVAADLFAANGIKIGEVTSDSAVIWVRLTKRPEADSDQNVPGSEGIVEVILKGPQSTLAEAVTVKASTDYIAQLEFRDLTPGTEYEVEAIARKSPEDKPVTVAKGSFRTPKLSSQPQDVTFTVVTGQDYHRRDDPARGHLIYDAMLELQPDFFVHTGDVVYYDREGPQAKDIAGARFKWHRMYSLPLQREFHLHVPSYFIRDDHDTVKDDCWPEQQYGNLTWEQGLALFREQTTAPEVPYRTVRWGKDLQVWMLEGRQFRSPNNMPDGPEKTILGREQWDWLEKSLDDSDATFKVIISPTPIVGPDRVKKNDNHANRGFKHEGDRLRALLASHDNLHLVCGDRHWQYVSVDPATGLREYSCGPTSDKHAGGWSDDQFDPQMHKFLRVKGGYLSGSVNRPEGKPTITFRHHAVDGSVVHEESWTAE